MTTLAGTTLFLRHDLRRDRVVVPVWVAALVLMAYASAAATETLFASAEERRAIATSLGDQPALLALYGPVLDPGSAGELAMSKLTVLYAVVAAILFVVLVRRHTRVEEESGRSELAGGTAVGRDAPMAAVVAECGLVAVVLGLLVGLADIAGGLPVGGSLWFGVSWAGTGLVATGAAAVACQVSASARTCGSIAAGLLGGAFAVRALGDAVDGVQWLSWLSPLGWNTQLRAWSEPRWWVAALYVLLAAALVTLAQAMRGRRDLGGGFLTARPGPADGTVSGPWWMAWRTHRAGLVLWTASTAAMGLLFGAMTPGFDDMLAGTGGQEMVDRLGGTLVAALLPIVAVVVTCFPVSVAAHAAHDETEGRTELALSTATSRTRWYAAGGLVGALGGTWLLVVTGVALAVGVRLAGASGGSGAVWAALGWVPAVWLVSALAMLGVAVRAGWTGWVVLVGFLSFSLVGELLRLPAWAVRLSPYTAVPRYPVEAWQWRPEIVLAALAAAAAWLGWRLFTRRDAG